MRQAVVYADQDDDGWVAEVPSLPGCISQGDTREEVLRNIREAIETWIEAPSTSAWMSPTRRSTSKSASSEEYLGIFCSQAAWCFNRTPTANPDYSSAAGR